MKFNLPNSLTLLRIILIPLIVFLFISGDDSNRFLVFILFLIASITDYLDGFFARYMKQQTNFGGKKTFHLPLITFGLGLVRYCWNDFTFQKNESIDFHLEFGSKIL